MVKEEGEGDDLFGMPVNTRPTCAFDQLTWKVTYRTRHMILQVDLNFPDSTAPPLGALR